ncbi:MAG: hypothetical protein CVV27_00810 [Candidatus Melainabacteria bacterium HGW-Melainabacteria-1]|nr:MAG: hypothetical protein CVV27_00810 [Candidatus Melainabacteria bacterium HGW-Melainabacteria-1]
MYKDTAKAGQGKGVFLRCAIPSDLFSGYNPWTFSPVAACPRTPNVAKNVVEKTLQKTRSVEDSFVDTLVNKNYEIAAANHPFLLEESQTCARLLLDKLSWEALGQAVVQDHLFATSSATTAQSYLRAIRFRLEEAPADLLGLLAHGDPSTASYSLFYLLIQRNRLLRELLEEPVRDCVLDGIEQISRADVLDFFEDKRQRNQVLSEWSDTTWRKFWGNTLKSVLETGLLHGQEPLRIVLAPVPAPLRSWLLAQNDELSLQLLLDPEAYR